MPRARASVRPAGFRLVLHQRPVLPPVLQEVGGRVMPALPWQWWAALAVSICAFVVSMVVLANPDVFRRRR